LALFLISCAASARRLEQYERLDLVERSAKVVDRVANDARPSFGQRLTRLNLMSFFRRLHIRVDGKQGQRRLASKVGDDLVEIADVLLDALKGQARAINKWGPSARRLPPLRPL
jgi:hypothetical protein